MTWFGQVSAWMALAMGVLFAAGAALQFSWGILPWAPMFAGALLLTGWFRTWRKMSGGLRLLGGAWGVALGLSLPGAPNMAIANNPNIATVDPVTGALLLSVPVIAAAGLALTVLHKESK